MRKYFLVLLVALCSTVAFANPSKIVRHSTDGIANEYIVALNGSVPPEAVSGIAQSLAASYNLELLRIWEYALPGFLCRASEENISALAGDARVKFIEQDFRTSAPQPEMSASYVTNVWNADLGQWEYLWNLDRLDETSYALHDSTYKMCATGNGIYAYVIDTGVQSNHTEFGSRVVLSLDFSDDRTNLGAVYTTDVTNGCTATGYQNQYLWHGTAVASVLGGNTVGAARPNIVSLKVARCGNAKITTSHLISAVNWIVSGSNPYKNDPGVINFSGFVPKWDDTPVDGTDFAAYSSAVDSMLNWTSMPFFAAAGNFAADASLFSPNDLARTSSNLGKVFSVAGSSVSGTSDTNDYRWQVWNGSTAATGHDSGSNMGNVSIFAPAVSIYAARHSLYVNGSGNQVDYDRASGTSFASPIVAGVAARYIEKQRSQSPFTTPTRNAVYDWLLNKATGTPLNTNTQTYWMCIDLDGLPTRDITWLSSPPALCPAGTFGQSSNNAPFYFPVVSNSAGAKLVFWDEENCQ